VKSSENIALLLVFMNICWLVKLNPTLSNIIMAIAKIAMVGNGKCAIGRSGDRTAQFKYRTSDV
jgi:hypothetical protein